MTPQQNSDPEAARAGGRQHARAGQFSFDAEYVRRLSDGDPDIERHFVNYFGALLLMKLRARTRSAPDAEDLRQEVFLRVLRTLRHGEGLHHPERLGAYVNKICDNVVFEHFRRQARVTELDSHESRLQSPGAGVEAELVSEELLRHVRAVIAELPVRDREVLQAVFLDDRDRGAVCRQFGIRREYLRVLVHRAKARFRELAAADESLGRRSATSAVPYATKILGNPPNGTIAATTRR